MSGRSTRQYQQANRVSKDLSYLPSRREFNHHIANIEIYDNKIHGLLQFTKNKNCNDILPPTKHTTSIYFEPGNHFNFQRQKPSQFPHTTQNRIYEETRIDREKRSRQEIKRGQTLAIESQKLKIEQVNKAAKKNHYPQLESTLFSNFDRKYLPERRRSKSPILIKPVSKYIRPAATKSISPFSPLDQLKVSREITDFTCSPDNQNIQTKSRNQNPRTLPKENYQKIIEERSSSLEASSNRTFHQELKHGTKLQDSSVQKQQRDIEISFKRQTGSNQEISDPAELRSSKKSADMNGMEEGFQIKLYPCDLNAGNVRSFIADKLVQIVKIDMELGQLREMYSENKNPQKKKALTKCLWERGWTIDQEEAQEYLGLKLPRNTPSSSTPSQQQPAIEKLVQDLVDKFLQGEYFWDKKVDKIISQNQINSTNFLVASLDLEKKGYLKVQDLTCFLNLHASSQNNFKNKHLLNLFQRFTREQKKADELPYSAFMKKICKVEKL